MGLEIEDARVVYGSTVAIDEVSFTVAKGEVLGLLGASGSGKSTLLRAVAGLEPLAAGAISWDGTDLSSVKVHQRNFGLVFQDGQLFPTMTVGRNIAYGLGRVSRAERKKRVEEMLELVGLPGYANRRPGELSGGQAQRVALARSLAPSPRALLLDEPLSALDTGLRRRLAGDLARILRDTGTTAVYVTHDHEEAYTVADRVAILANGRVLQVGPPEELRARPASRALALFLGFRAFLTQAEARVLGWAGDLPSGMVLGVGPASFVLDEAGVTVPVAKQSLTKDAVEIEVVLPGGQHAVLASPGHVHTDSVRVRLIGGAAVPG